MKRSLHSTSKKALILNNPQYLPLHVNSQVPPSSVAVVLPNEFVVVNSVTMNELLCENDKNILFIHNSKTIRRSGPFLHVWVCMYGGMVGTFSKIFQEILIPDLGNLLNIS